MDMYGQALGTQATGQGRNALGTGRTEGQEDGNEVSETPNWAALG